MGIGIGIDIGIDIGIGIGVGKLFCLLGKSGVGKDTLLEKIIEDQSFGILPVVPYTTRPKREHETNGIQYHFVSEAYMHELERENKIIEKREYLTVDGIWYYFTVSFDISSGKNFMLITTPRGVSNLVEKIGKDNIIIVFLEADDKTRLERTIQRESMEKKPNYSEVCRRYLADEEDFNNEDTFRGLTRFCINANYDIPFCLDQFKSILERL